MATTGNNGVSLGALPAASKSIDMSQFNRVTGPSSNKLAGQDSWMNKRLERTPEKKQKIVSSLKSNGYGWEDIKDALTRNGYDTDDIDQAGGDYSNGSGFMSTLASMGVGAKAGDMIASLGANGEYGTAFSEEEKAAQSGIRSALEMIPGYGTAIAAATGVVDAFGDALGVNLSSVNKDTADRAGIQGTGFNKLMNMLPGNSMIWGTLSRAFGNGRTLQLDVSDKVLGMSDGYSGTVKDLQAAKDLGNKQLFFGQTDEANKFIESQRNALSIMERVNKVNTQRKQSDYYQDLQNQNINRFAGQNYLNMHVGKNGMKLMSIEEARAIIALRESDVEKLQNGGNIPGIDSNILPEGSLHKELNHLAEVNPELEDITKKGIPVTENESGEQVAEIESDELIFRLEVTQRLEELMKDGSEEAMIEAGKLLASEIIENTVDNTGQITEENGNSDSDNKQ